MAHSIKQVAERIMGMRQILGISVEEMAKNCNISTEEYMKAERGETEFTFTFLNNCAKVFGLDLAELITGGSAHLKSYAVDKKGGGLQVERRAGFDYRLLASRFDGRKIEPYLVTVPYLADWMDTPIKTSTHDGQEMDFILEGQLEIIVNGKTEILDEGDSIFYNSAQPHGMRAVGGAPCKFLAILAK